MDAVEIYKKILNGEKERFPTNYWANEEGKDRGKECAKYLLYDYLKLSNKEIEKAGVYTLLTKHKLAGMLKCAYKDNSCELLKEILPEETYVNKRYKKRNSWGDKADREKIVRDIMQKEGWAEEECVKKIDVKIMKKYNKEGLFGYYNNSPYKLIKDIFDLNLEPWEVRRAGKGFWDKKENRIRAIKWVIEKEGLDTPEKIKNNITLSTFAKYRLKEVIVRKYNYSIAEAIMEAYPNQFRKTDFRNIKRQPKNRLEIEQVTLEESKKLYKKYKTELNDKIKQMIMQNAIQGKSFCILNKDEIHENDISELTKQGMKVKEENDIIKIEWY